MSEVEDSRVLEIYRILLDINNRLKNYQEIAFWGTKYLEKYPDDNNVLTIMALHYYNLEDYDKFLDMANRLRNIMRYDLIIVPLLLEYYIEIKGDFENALVIAEDAERYILDNKALMTLHPNILFNKARIYKLKGNFNIAREFGEKAWFYYQSRKNELYHLLVEIYSSLNEWEILEDFCFKAYLDDYYNPELFSSLYFAFLKRNSEIKANELYERVKKNYPNYLEKLNKIKDRFINKNST